MHGHDETWIALNFHENVIIRSSLKQMIAQSNRFPSSTMMILGQGSHCLSELSDDDELWEK
jgi:hypothetical protein